MSDALDAIEETWKYRALRAEQRCEELSIAFFETQNILKAMMQRMHALEKNMETLLKRVVRPTPEPWLDKYGDYIRDKGKPMWEAPSSRQLHDSICRTLRATNS